MEDSKSFKRAQNSLINIAENLMDSNVPQVKSKRDLISKILSDNFFEGKDIINFENIRIQIRDLIQFLIKVDNRVFYPNFDDQIISSVVGEELEPYMDLKNYKRKVNKFIEKNKERLVIYKLTHNLELTKQDFKELENIFTKELGTKEDYEKEYKNTPFGLLIRKIAKLDHDSVMDAFSKFINDESLNTNQINFIKKVINYVETNGYIENISELTKAPFDKPIPFTKLFDRTTKEELIKTINKIRDNAITVNA